MTDELKPCPFCNNDPRLEGDDRWWYVGCRCGADGGADQTAKGAVELWNTRPIEDALRAQLAEAQALHDLDKQIIIEKNAEIMRLKNLRGNL